jgi:hypothetical protein
MRAPVLAFAILAGCIAAFPADGSEPFAGLEEVELDVSCVGPVRARFAPELATVDGTVLVDPESGMKYVRGLKARPTDGAPELLVDYLDGLSCDPTFVVFRSSDDRDAGLPALEVWGLTIAVPGDGHLYVYGHTNSFFSRLRKFAVSEGTIDEVVQPFHHAGIETKTIVNVRLLYEPGSASVVSEIAAGGEAVIIACREDDWCLVRDAVGLTGWVKLESSGPEPSLFEGVFYAGD